MEPWQRLAAIGRRQLGLVALEQAMALGLSGRTVQWHAARYGWVRLHPGVYALPGSVRSYERDALAALLATDDRSAISHWAAASLAQPTLRQHRPIHLVVPVDRIAPRLDGIRSHRSRTLRTTDVITVSGIRQTTAARTLCDLAAFERAQLHDLIASALQSRRTTIERVEACSRRLGTHRGAGRLRTVLAQLSGTSSASGFERRVREWLGDNGLAPHPCLYAVRAEDDVIVELDIAYPDEMVYVDCLGFPWHSLPSSLTNDAVRGNGVVAAGWQSLRLTEEQFAARDPRFLRQLRALLEQRHNFAPRWHQAIPEPARLRPRLRAW